MDLLRRTLSSDNSDNSGLDSSISRLSSISGSSGILESYSYLGLDTAVARDHPQAGVNRCHISQTGDAGDQYTGMNRFGHMVEHLWYDTNTEKIGDDV